MRIDLSDFPKALEVAYLNSASISLMPKPAFERMIEFQRKIGAGGTVDFDEETETNVFENLRREAASLLNARESEIAVVSGATEGICAVAWSLKCPRGSNIVSTDAEFPSVVYPWMRVAQEKSLEVRLVRNHDGIVDEAELGRLVDEKTAVVAISHVEYGTGQTFDPRWLAELAHSHGAVLMLDATQSAGLVPLNVPRDQVDIVVSGGYKGLLGPFGAGILYIRHDLSEELVPSFAGWRSTATPYELDAAKLSFAAGAKKFEFGTLSYASALGLAESMNYLRDLGYSEASAHCKSLTRALTSKLKSNEKIPEPSLLTPEGEGRYASIVSVRFAGQDSSAVASKLLGRKVIVSQRFNGVRFSFHVYNTEDDLARAMAALEVVLR